MSDPFEIERAIAAGLESLDVAEPIGLPEWSEKHFYLSAESSYVEKQWETYPFQRAIMQFMAHDDVEEFTFAKSARLGYTKMLLACIFYNAHHRRRNQAIWQPTEGDANGFCKTELETGLRDVKAMEKVFPSLMKRHKDNTLEQKKFIGSMLHIRGAHSAGNFRRISVDNAYIDELDGMEYDIDKEGSAPKLAGKRVEGSTYPKLICGSTLKIKGYSHTEDLYLAAEKRFKFHIPCPHCGVFQPLRWGGKDKNYGFKWVGNDASTVGHLCEHCQVIFTQQEYLKVWTQGKYIAEDGTWIDHDFNFWDINGNRVARPARAAAHCWTAYSPQTTWEKITREFIDAKAKAKTGDTADLKTWVNTTLGESWEEEVQKTDSDELQRRAEPYRLKVVPFGGLVLVAGVDVQDNRFEVVVWAIGYGEEMWVVDYRVIDANPALKSDWAKLDLMLSTVYEHASGSSLRIEAAAVDTGGHFTHEVYNFCRGSWPHEFKGRLFAIKGDTKQGQPIKGKASQQDVNWLGKIIKKGIKLWLVGTDTAKDLLHGRLSVKEAGPGYVHFSSDLPAEFYTQLTAEHRILQKTSSGEVHRWIKKGVRNEVLDCTVYAMFCAHALDLHKYTEKMWEKLREAVQPEMSDLFAMPPAQAGLPPAAVVSALPMSDISSAVLAARLRRQ